MTPIRPEKRTCKRDLFIVYAADDHVWVRGYLVPALGLARKRMLLMDNFQPGTLVHEQIEQAIFQSRYTLLIVSHAAAGSFWAKWGRTLATALSAMQGVPFAIPLWRDADAAVPLNLKIVVSLNLTNKNHVNWETELAKLRRLLKTPPPPPISRIECPYPGMLPFRNARYFYGRRKESAKLATRLRVPDASQQAVFIIGPSGSGKSSLLRAGLTLPDSQRWLIRSVRPDNQPLHALWQAVASPYNTMPVSPSASNLTALLEQLLATECATRLLLIVDPLEELFTRSQRGQRDQFCEFATQLCEDSHCIPIFAVRADFYSDLMKCPLWPIAEHRLLPIAPLRGEGLREAIEQPARENGVHFEPALVRRLIDDTAHEPGALPLLQETLRYLWTQREHNRLHKLITLRLYGHQRDLDAGGPSMLAQIMARNADATIASLRPVEIPVAWRILLRLVQFGHGRPHTRQRRTLAELQNHGDHPRLVAEVIHRLVSHRLLTVDDDSPPLNMPSPAMMAQHTRHIDLAHEALIRSWPQYTERINASQSTEQTRRKLEGRAKEWDRLKRQGGLLDTIEVIEAQRWHHAANATGVGCSPTLYQYIAVSTQNNRRRHILWRLTAACLIILAVTVSLVAADAMEQRDRTEALRLTTEAKILIETEPYNAAKRLLEALELANLASTERVARQWENRRLRRMFSASHPFASIDWSGSVLAHPHFQSIRVWDTDTWTQLGDIRAQTESMIERVTISPAFRMIISASANGIISGVNEDGQIKWTTRIPSLIHPTFIVPHSRLGRISVGGHSSDHLGRLASIDAESGEILFNLDSEFPLFGNQEPTAFITGTELYGNLAFSLESSTISVARQTSIPWETASDDEIQRHSIIPVGGTAMTRVEDSLFVGDGQGVIRRLEFSDEFLRKSRSSDIPEWYISGSKVLTMDSTNTILAIGLFSGELAFFETDPKLGSRQKVAASFFFNERIESIRWSDKGNQLAVAFGSHQIAIVAPWANRATEWNRSLSQVEDLLPGALAHLPNSQILAISTSKNLHLLDLRSKRITGQCLSEPNPSESSPTYTSDLYWLHSNVIIQTLDKSVVRQWKITTVDQGVHCKLVNSRTIPGFTTAKITATKNGIVISSNNKSGAILLDPTSLDPVLNFHLPESLNEASLVKPSPDGTYWAGITSDNRFTVSTYRDGNPLSFEMISQGVSTRAFPTDLSWCPNERFVAAGFSDGSVAITDIVERKAYVHKSDSDSVKRVKWTSENTIIVGMESGRVLIISADRNEIVGELSDSMNIMNMEWIHKDRKLFIHGLEISDRKRLNSLKSFDVPTLDVIQQTLVDYVHWYESLEN